MPEFLFVLLLNFDVFVSGLALGMSGICVRPAAGALVAGVSAGCFAVAGLLGAWFAAIFPMELLQRLGLILVVAITALWLMKFYGKERGGLAGIWRTPDKLDKNDDKRLAWAEGVVLAFAAALDSLSGGVAFGLLGKNTLFWGAVSFAVAWLMFMGANRLVQAVRNNIK